MGCVRPGDVGVTAQRAAFPSLQHTWLAAGLEEARAIAPLLLLLGAPLPPPPLLLGAPLLAGMVCVGAAGFLTRALGPPACVAGWQV